MLTAVGWGDIVKVGKKMPRKSHWVLAICLYGNGTKRLICACTCGGVYVRLSVYVCVCVCVCVDFFCNYSVPYHANALPNVLCGITLRTYINLASSKCTLVLKWWHSTMQCHYTSIYSNSGAPTMLSKCPGAFSFFFCPNDNLIVCVLCTYTCRERGRERERERSVWWLNNGEGGGGGGGRGPGTNRRDCSHVAPVSQTNVYKIAGIECVFTVSLVLIS